MPYTVPMARWEPNASQRLARAALDLFAERGYENTTVIDIAQRAGLGKTTFFRHFQDKREVLFSGSVLDELLARADSRRAGLRHPAGSGGARPGRGRPARSSHQPAVNSSPAGGP